MKFPRIRFFFFLEKTGWQLSSNHHHPIGNSLPPKEDRQRIGNAKIPLEKKKDAVGAFGTIAYVDGIIEKMTR